MIVSETTCRSRSRWLQACVLLGAMLVFPLGLAIAQDHEAVEKRLGAAVAEGEITLEQAEAMMGTLRMTVVREGIMHRIREIEAEVKAGRMSREEGERAIAETRRAMEKLTRRGDATERKHDEGLVGHYKRMGVSLEMLGQFKKALAEAGVTDKQMEGTFGGMLRVVHEMKSEGKKYEMDPRMAKYLKADLNLTAKQIELVEGIARRVVHGMKESDRER